MLVIIMKFSLFTLPSLVFGLFMSPGHGRRLRVILRVDHTQAIAAVLRACGLSLFPSCIPHRCQGSRLLHPWEKPQLWSLKREPALPPSPIGNFPAGEIFPIRVFCRMEVINPVPLPMDRHRSLPRLWRHLAVSPARTICKPGMRGWDGEWHPPL